MGLCNRNKGRICAEEKEGVPIVKRRKGGSKRVYLGAAEEGIYLAIKVTINSTSILCRKEG